MSSGAAHLPSTKMSADEEASAELSCPHRRRRGASTDEKGRVVAALAAVGEGFHRGKM